MSFLQGTQGILVAFLFFVINAVSVPAEAGTPKKLKSFFKPSSARIEVIENDSLPITQLEEEAIKSEESTPINLLFEKAWDNDVLDPFKKQKPFLGSSFDCSSFGLPVPVAKVISKFGMRRGRMHTGTDIKVFAGDPIVAVADGKVRFAKYYGGYGNIVIIRHHNGLESVYAHLSKISVEVNQSIKKGEELGLGGRTGRATGTHLHFEIRVAGRPINPESIYDFARGTVCNLGYPKRIGSAAKASEPSERSAVEDALTLKGARVHRVRSGETLFAIAKQYGVSLSDMYKWNRMNASTRLSIGQEVLIKKPGEEELNERKPSEAAVASVKELRHPGSEKRLQEHRIQKGETLSAIARTYGTTVSELCRINDLDPDASLRLGQKIQLNESANHKLKAEKVKTEKKSPAHGHHVVQDGDNLGKIAKKHGVSIEDLCVWNEMQRTDRLRIGQKIKTSK